MTFLLAFVTNAVRLRAVETRMSLVAAEIALCFIDRHSVRTLFSLPGLHTPAEPTECKEFDWVDKRHSSVFLCFVQRTRFIKGRLMFTNIVFQQTLADVPTPQSGYKSIADSCVSILSSHYSSEVAISAEYFLTLEEFFNLLFTFLATRIQFMPGIHFVDWLNVYVFHAIDSFLI